MDGKKCMADNVSNTKTTVSRGVGPSPGGVVGQGRGIRTPPGQHFYTHVSQNTLPRDKPRNLKIVEQTSYTCSANTGKKLTTTGVGPLYRSVYRTLQVTADHLGEPLQRGPHVANTLHEPRSILRQTRPHPPVALTTQRDKHQPGGPSAIHGLLTPQDIGDAVRTQRPVARPRPRRALGYPSPVFASVTHGHSHVQMKVKPTVSMPPISVQGAQYKGQGQTERSQESHGGQRDALRHIVIDGCNAAYSHGHHLTFSGAGIHLAAAYFLRLGHTVAVVLPQTCKKRFRKLPLPDQERLKRLEESGVLVYTPTRSIHGRYVQHHEERMLLRLAEQTEAVIVSNGHFRDLMMENKTWKKMVEERLLMFTFAGNIFMPLEDPLGRHGPSLATFLRNGSCRQSQSRPPNVARVLPVPAGTRSNTHNPP